LKGRRPEEGRRREVYVIGRRNASDACQMCQSLFTVYALPKFRFIPFKINDIEQKSLAKTYYTG